MLEKYKTVYEGGEGEIVEKKSRFIATVRPVQTEEEALAFIEEMKKKENITEKLKQDNQMEWVGKMNNLKLIAEELVKQELIMN